MPLTLQEFKSSSPDDLLEKYSPFELEMFMRRISRQPHLEEPIPGVSPPEAQVETRFQPSARSGITPYDPSQDFFSTQNLGAMAGNIPASAYHMGSDVAEAVTSPIKTGKAAWEAGAGGLLEGLGRRFGVTYDENEGLGYDPELLKKSLVEDPTGMALDVAPGTQAIGAGARAARLGTRASALARKTAGPRAGRAVRTAVQAADSPLAQAATSPVKALAQTARGIGRGTGGLSRAASSALSGIDPGVLSTAREVLSEYGKKGTEAGDIAKRGREALEVARKVSDPIPEAVTKIELGIASELDQIGSNLRGTVGRQLPESKAMIEFENNVVKRLKDRDVKLYRHTNGELGLDFRKSAIPEEAASQRRITKAMGAILQARKSGTFEDLWRARRQIDEANSTALKQKFGNTEIGMLKELRAELNKLMDTVDNPRFKELNQDYKEGIALRDRFDKLAGTRVDPEGQISAVIRAIRQSRQSSNEFLKTVERQTGTPLRAIAAGTELQGLLPRGLVGRAALTGLTALNFGSDVLFAFFLAPPAALRGYLKVIGATERTAKTLGAITDRIMGLPRAAALAEQGLTIGAIIQQLSDQPEQPSFLGQFAPR